jgi:hypothetical protein
LGMIKNVTEKGWDNTCTALITLLLRQRALTTSNRHIFSQWPTSFQSHNFLIPN